MSNPVNRNPEIIDRTLIDGTPINPYQKLAALKLLGQISTEFTGKFIPLEINEQFQNSTPPSEYQNPTTQFQNYSNPIQSNNNQFNPSQFAKGLPPVPGSLENSVQNQSQLRPPLTSPGVGEIHQNLISNETFIQSQNQINLNPTAITTIVSNPISNQPSQQPNQNTTTEIVKKLPGPNIPKVANSIKTFFRNLLPKSINPDGENNIAPFNLKNPRDVHSLQKRLELEEKSNN